MELPSFERYRKDYLDDDAFNALQQELMASPLAGDVIMGTGGLRKLRFSNQRRGKGKRGGTRIIYYWWNGGSQFWLFTLYDKGEIADLSETEKKLFSQALAAEFKKRGVQ